MNNSLLGKPKKVIRYKNSKVRLYPKTVYCKVLGKSYQYVMLAEQKGYLPKKTFFFVTGAKSERQYYSDLELLALTHAINKVPPAKRKIWGKNSEFCQIITKTLEDVRKALGSGVIPDVPIMLEFGSANDMKDAIRAILSEYGIQGELTINNIYTKFLSYHT